MVLPVHPPVVKGHVRVQGFQDFRRQNALTPRVGRAFLIDAWSLLQFCRQFPNL